MCGCRGKVCANSVGLGKVSGRRGEGYWVGLGVKIINEHIRLRNALVRGSRRQCAYLFRVKCGNVS